MPFGSLTSFIVYIYKLNNQNENNFEVSSQLHIGYLTSKLSQNGRGCCIKNPKELSLSKLLLKFPEFWLLTKFSQKHSKV